MWDLNTDKARPLGIFWEDGIMSGYRHPKSSALDCVLSSFQMTNETVNIWTHFLPTCMGMGWEWRGLRTAAFVYPFLYDNIPLFYRLLFCLWSTCAWSDAVAGYCYHLLFALLTGFLFASHLPERLAPGRFDYIERGVKAGDVGVRS
ncbi:PREDICTED: progestin and adipoQ receptor family member 6 [Charadrius vociferus]|uniref:progestin and adipoQ receptor family member 6 n=1 Tax=Charadrius vociferus TaxID=50402 RepID=UPI000521482B|nr:PREDICTED: progestin and adipoQ receptor family member 6 [Charadrius vociferus]